VPIDQQISVAGTAAVPISYTVPNATEFQLLCVNATVDGTAASGLFLATVEIVSDGGVVVARAPCFTTLAAGASAEISWFQLRRSDLATAAVTPYQVAVLTTPDIRSYWPLDETAGTTFADLGPSDVPLTITGPVLIGQAPLITSGHSATFSGGVDGLGRSKQYASGIGTYGAWPSPGSFSVECWYQGTFSAATNPWFVSFDDGHFRVFQFRLGGAGVAALTSFRTVGAANPVANGATIVNDGVKRHLVGTFNGTTFTTNVYVNGVLDGTSAGTGVFVTDGPDPAIATHWASPLPDKPIGGTIDEVAIYSRDLTVAEILAHYNAGLV
jgi:hypothetical protein